jgi:streptogramin lyase
LPSDTSGIHLIDFAAQKIYNSNNNPEQLPFLKKQSIRSFAFDEENDKLLYGAWGEGLTIYDFKTGQEQKELFGIARRDEGRTINSIIKTGPGRFLFYIGAACYEITANDFQNYHLPERSIIPGYRNDLINTIILFPSGDKQYWAGTTVGLAMVDYKKPFYTELSLQQAGVGEIANCTDMIISQSGRLYCTYSSNQLVITEKNRKEFSVHSFSAKGLATITEICEDKNQNIWIGTTRGLYIYDDVTGKIKSNMFLPAGQFALNCNVLYCDDAGNIWISTRDPFGLYRYHAGTRQLQKINNDITAYFEKQGFNARISKIEEDRQGHLWMTSRTSGGIVCYTKEKDEWKLYVSSKTNFKFPGKNPICDMLTDPPGIIWFSNYAGDGLIRFDPMLDSIARFNRTDGLQSNYIRSITADSSGGIWLISEYGISRFDLKESKPQSAIAYSGFRDEDQHAVFDPFSNSLIFSAVNKLLFLPARRTHITSFAPAPLIDKISINNEQQFMDWRKGSLQLQHEKNNIAIDFTAPGFVNADKIRFAYRLSGADKDWRYADGSRTVQYASLAPGEYTFSIKTSFENSEWGPAHSLFLFIIRPPYWKTWWFRTLILASISGMVILFVRRRIHFIRHEARLKQQIAETEMMALRAQMNPHFIFNCLNSIDNLIQNNEKEKATGYLARFAKLIRSILENSKHQLIPVWKDMETLRLYLELEALRCDNKFSYSVNIAEEILNGDYKIPPLVIQPFVENAIHHGLMNKLQAPRNLSVSAQTKNSEIHFTVVDNGVGRAQAEKLKQLNKWKHHSLGIDITRERINLFNSGGLHESVKIIDLADSHNEPAGTKVEIQFNNG